MPKAIRFLRETHETPDGARESSIRLLKRKSDGALADAYRDTDPFQLRSPVPLRRVSAFLFPLVDTE